MLATEISARHLANMSILERFGSALSLVGLLFVCVTFLGSNKFHKPINRLVFFACVGNALCTVATSISRAPINYDGTVNNVVLCQTQAFFIQTFMPADVFWNLACALNIYHRFYRRCDEQDLRRYEKWYFIACYGMPLIIAIILLCLSTFTTPANGPIYGNATLWCWIDSKYDMLRIWVFYFPAWVAWALTTGIYTYAWKDIAKHRRSLRNLQQRQPAELTISSDRDPDQLISVTRSIVTETSAATNNTDGHFPKPALPQPTKQKGAEYTVSVTTSSRQQHKTSRRTMEASSALWSYTKIALLFFLAMCVTWLPSSANRLYPVINHGEVSLFLQYASAFVLPLQGFWNTIVYIFTSLHAVKSEWARLRSGRGMSGGGVSALLGRSGRSSVAIEVKRKVYTKSSAAEDSATELNPIVGFKESV